MNLNTFIIRIIICFILSMCIGIERQYRHKTVGLRTNVLVSLGAFMFVSITFNSNTNDYTRIASQVVSGIGFLGAGIILKDGNRVKGLNTAATLWCVASIGVLTATGMVIEACIGTSFILISNILFRIISKKIMDKIKINESCTLDIKCEINHEKNIKNLIIKLANKYNLMIKKFEKFKTSDNEINLKINIISSNKLYFDEIAKTITTSANINSLYIEHNKLINSDNEDIDEE